MFKGNRQSIYGKTKKETLEKLTKVINDIQYAKIHNLQNFSAATTTLSAWATECVETYSKDYVRGNTYYAYKNIINRHLGEEVEKKLNNLAEAMAQGIFSATTKKLLDDLEAQKKAIETDIIQYQIRNPIVPKEQIYSRSITTVSSTCRYSQIVKS